MLVEAIITLIIVAAMFYVAPGVLTQVRIAAPDLPVVDGGGVETTDAGQIALNQSATSIGTTVAGALDLSTVGLIMMGIAIMIGGFMLIRGYQGGR